MTSLLIAPGCMVGGGHGGNGGGSGASLVPGATLTSLSPSSVTAGGPPFVLTVNGSGFVAGGTIYVNGNGGPYNFVSSTQVTVLIDGGSIANAGSIPFVVTIPTPNTLQSNSLSLTISPPNPGSQACALLGLSRFLFTGFDSTGPVTIAGSFGVDSKGNVNGEEDFKDLSTVRTAQAITGGTCTNNPAIANQGTVTLTTAAGTSTYTFVLQKGGGGAPRGRIAESGDTNGISGSGVFVESPPDGFFSGDYAFGLLGNDSSGSRMSLAGRFTDSDNNTFNTPGTLSAGLGDVNDGGTVSASQAISGTVGVPDLFSRCATTLTIGSQTLKLVFYVNSSTGGFAMDVDSGSTPVLAGLISAQANAGTYSNGALNAPVVYSTWGVTPGTPPSSVTSLGIASGFNSGAGTFNLQFDTVSGGVASLNLAVSGTYSIASNGRATTSYTLGGKTYNDVLYLDATNDGYILGTSGNTVEWGFFEAQASGPFDNSTISGATFAAGTWFPPVSTSPDIAAEITFNNGNISATAPAGALTGTYAVAASGRGTASVNLPVFGSNNLVFYLIGPGSIEVMSSDNITGNSIGFLHF